MNGEVLEPEKKVASEEMQTPQTPVFEAPLDASQKGVKYASPLVLVAVIVAFYFSYSAVFKQKTMSEDSLSEPSSLATNSDTASIVANHEDSMAKLKARFKAHHAAPQTPPQEVVLEDGLGASWDDDVMLDGALQEAPAAAVADTQAIAQAQMETAKLTTALEAAKLQVASLNALKSEQEKLIAQQKEAMAKLEAQLAQVRVSSEDAHHAQTRLAFALDVASGKPYVEALARADWLSQTQRSAFAPFAEKGLPKHEALEQEFAKAVDVWLQRPLPEKASVWAGSVHNLASLVQIRKVGAQQVGVDDEARIARAEAHLKQKLYGDVTREINDMSPKVKVIFEDVSTMISRYVVAQEQLEHVRDHAYATQEARP